MASTATPSPSWFARLNESRTRVKVVRLAERVVRLEAQVEAQPHLMHELRQAVDDLQDLVRVLAARDQ